MGCAALKMKGEEGAKHWHECISHSLFLTVGVIQLSIQVPAAFNWATMDQNLESEAKEILSLLSCSCQGIYHSHRK